MVAFTAYSVKLVVCEGVYTGSLKVVVTTDCYNQLLSLNKGSLSKETLTLVGGNGGATVTIKGGTLKELNDDFRRHQQRQRYNNYNSALRPQPDLVSRGVSRYSLFQQSNIDTSTCAFVSYGGDTTGLPVYTKNLTSLPLTTSSLQTSCCKELSDILGSSSSLGNYDPSYEYTCTSTGGAVCGGDLGAPVYCKDKTTNKQVVVGMATNYGCVVGETFLALDLTGGNLAGFSS
ncbi:hypothetical protein C0Q70_01258 [Pomacea canaliculata]|uniref:Peptidase S1 domain-containing protein n=1 Tax=Pomacea canaliculata TaxID=400727 RepID=A0A2T7PZ02_POMCA|nr:hypothetical protein C0Q70_01258 [Pomacea canaliculata]